eukprot:5271008-Ditylum_brightwellii.AAC.1
MNLRTARRPALSVLSNCIVSGLPYAWPFPSHSLNESFAMTHPNEPYAFFAPPSYASHSCCPCLMFVARQDVFPD